jgi:hypothetical protein
MVYLTAATMDVACIDFILIADYIFYLSVVYVYSQTSE